VGDAGARSYVVYGADGQFLRSVPLTDADGFPTPASLLHPSGGIVQWGVSLVFAPGEQPSFPTSIPIRLTALDGTGTREVGSAWMPPRNLNLPTISGPPGGGGGAMTMRINVAGGGPQATGFEPRIHAAVLPDGRVAVADSTDYRIVLFDPSGAEPTILGRSIRPRPAGEEEQRLERQRRLDDLASGATPPPMAMVMGGGGVAMSGPAADDWRRAQEERIASMGFWDEIPVVQRLASDWEGRLWVERAALPGEEGPLDLLSGTGSYLGSLPPGGVRTPSAFGPGGLAAFIETDELDVPCVRVVRLNGLP
jgi:hypothetical protein